MKDKKKCIIGIIKCMKIVMLIPIVFMKACFRLTNKVKKNIIKRFRFSITFKMTVVYTSIFAITFLLLNLLVLVGFTIYNGRNVEENLQKDFQLVSYNLDSSTKISGNDIKKLSQIENVDITIFDPKYKSIYSTKQDKNNVEFYKGNNSGISRLNGKYLILLHNASYSTSSTNTSIPSIVFNDAIKISGKKVYIQIEHNLLTELISIFIAFIGLIFIDLVFTIIIIKVGSRASRKMIRPIENMTSIAKNITINDLDTRLDISGAQDELRDLAETFNEMLNRIQKSYKQQNQFVSDASHELRTPISVIKGYASLLSRWGKNDKDVLDESIESIKTEAKSMQDLIEKLLFIARGDNHTQTIEKRPILLHKLMDEIIKETRLIDKQHEIIDVRNENITINADVKLLKEALRIFIDNSIKYTPSGGKIIINSYIEKSEVVIIIEDTGSGISREDLPNIFNRFYRADKSRTKETGGTGLGLSIAKWIVLVHSGKINVKSRINYGTTITIFLPLHF